jgi:hypothetical protein
VLRFSWQMHFVYLELEQDFHGCVASSALVRSLMRETKLIELEAQAPSSAPRPRPPPRTLAAHAAHRTHDRARGRPRDLPMLSHLCAGCRVSCVSGEGGIGWPWHYFRGSTWMPMMRPAAMAIHLGLSGGHGDT